VKIIDKMTKKIYSLAQKEFLLWEYLLIFLIIDYVILFSAESVLPGTVTNFFNINILLLAITFLWILISRLEEPKKSILPSDRLIGYSLIILALLFFITLFFVFLGISVIEMLVYFILIAILIPNLYNFLKK
jgi:hypothetical protein